MRVQYAKRFEKRFKKLPQNIKNKTIALKEVIILDIGPHESVYK